MGYLFLVIMGLPVDSGIIYPINMVLCISLCNSGMAFAGTNMKTFLCISKALAVACFQNKTVCGMKWFL